MDYSKCALCGHVVFNNQISCRNCRLLNPFYIVPNPVYTYHGDQQPQYMSRGQSYMQYNYAHSDPSTVGLSTASLSTVGLSTAGLRTVGLGTAVPGRGRGSQSLRVDAPIGRQSQQAPPSYQTQHSATQNWQTFDHVGNRHPNERSTNLTSYTTHHPPDRCVDPSIGRQSQQTPPSYQTQQHSATLDNRPTFDDVGNRLHDQRSLNLMIHHPPDTAPENKSVVVYQHNTSPANDDAKNHKHDADGSTVDLTINSAGKPSPGKRIISKEYLVPHGTVKKAKNDLGLKVKESDNGYKMDVDDAGTNPDAGTTVKDSSRASEVASDTANNKQDADAKDTKLESTDDKREGECTIDGAITSRTNTSMDKNNSGMNQELVFGGGKPYNKKDKQPEVYVKPTTRSQTNKKIQSQDQEDVKVHFHVVVSPEFKMDLDHDQVFIRFSYPELGGFDKSIWQMDCQRTLPESDAYKMMHGIVNIPKRLLAHESKVRYKYVVHRLKQETVLFEFIPRKTSHNNILNREMFIPKDKYSRMEEWHQYDGAMHREPDGGLKGFFKSVQAAFKGQKSPHQKIIEDTQAATIAMLPCWVGFDGFSSKETGDRSAEDILEEIQQVCFCVKNCYVSDDFMRTDETKLQHELYKYVRPRLQAFHKGNFEHEQPEEDQLRLAAALTIIQLYATHKLPLDKDDINGLCYALCLRLGTDKRLPDFEGLDVHFNRTKGSLKSSLAKFLGFACDQDPMWVLGIPLFHFLRDEVKPGSSLNLNAKHRDPSWWGTTGLQGHIMKSKKKNLINDSHINLYQKNLEPLLDIDTLLTRTLMAVMSFKLISETNMELFSTEAIIANVYFHLQTYDINTNEMDILPPLWEKLIVAVRHRRDAIQATNDEKTLSSEIQTAQMQANIGIDTLHLLAHKVSFSSDYKQLVTVIHLIGEIMQNCTMAYQRLPSDDKASFEKQVNLSLGDIHQRLQDTTLAWLRKLLSKCVIDGSFFYNKYELEIFNSLMSVNFGISGESWKHILMNHFHQRYSQLTPKDKLNIYCHANYKEYDPSIEDFFSKMAFESVDELCNKYEGDLQSLIEISMGPNSSRISTVLSKVFSTMWKDDIDRQKILDLVITWPTFARFVVLKEERHILDDQCQKKICEGLDVFTDAVVQLMSGDIPITTVTMLDEHREIMRKVQDVLDKSNQKGSTEDNKDVVSGSQILLKVLECRKQEVQAFREMKEAAIGVSHICATLKPVGLDELKRKIEKPDGILKVSEVCRVIPYSRENSKLEKYTPQVTYYGLSNEVLSCAKHFPQFECSSTFMKCWKEHSNQVRKQTKQQQDQLSFDDLVEKIWEPACDEFMDICRKLKKAGQITFAQVDKYFGDYKDKYDKLTAEFRHMSSAANMEKDWVNLRVDQIKQYHQLHRYTTGARLMLDLKNKFKLTGNFGKLDLLLSAETNRDKPLNSINKELVDAGQSLMQINGARENCLREFLKCQELVTWLRTSLKGPNEVKVLVDLAMITAHGQGDYEVQKVKCLHAATIGYASLIYDLKPNIKFERFLELCKSVWRCLESDPELPTKLRDTQSNLEWLKKVKESKGSMELNAFAQAELINTDGIYKIGHISEDDPKKVEEALQLVIPKTVDREKAQAGEREKAQTYSYQQLNDLQSKLMLVAGKAQKGKEQVDRFVEIFDGVTRMAAVYIKLCNAGSILFKNWVGTFYNKPGRKVNSLINFGIADHIIQGHTTELVDVISLVCNFLDECLQQWTHHIEIMRMDFAPLNFFTTEQLVILRRDLAILCQADKQVTNSVYPMLHAVHQHCTDELLGQAAKIAFRDIKALEMAARPTPMEDDKLQDAESVAMKDQSSLESDVAEATTREYIDGLMESGYSEKLAMRALKECGAEGFQDAMMWCMENVDESSDDVELVYTNSEDNDEDNFATPPQVEQMDYQVEQTLEDFTTELLQHHEDEKRSLIAKLEELWGNYLHHVSTSVSDYLSVEHLGHILTQLQETYTVNRPFPTYLNTGQPNLLVCPKAQVLQFILSLYMHGEGRTKPLPHRDEVLLCSSDTNAEQVELLLRRATNDGSNKIYCLADVGQLDYEVAQKTETYFEKHCKKKPELRLVVICSRETEDRSHIVTFLEQYRIQCPLMYSPTQIQSYVKEKFTVAQDGKSAAELDPECVTVRLVLSHRAGVGKTLKVRRLKERLEHMTEPRPNDPLPLCVTIPIQRRHVEVSAIMEKLCKFTPDPSNHIHRIFHIDLAHEVLEGVDHLLFNLLVLGSVMDKDGKVWQRYDNDLYIVESMPLLQREVTRQGDGETVTCVHHVLQLLPSLTCWSPMECLLILKNQNIEMSARYPNWKRNDNDQLMDEGQFRSETFQRPYQYLKRYRDEANLLDVNPAIIEDNHIACLEILIRYCGIREPSWAELSHFVHFLNIQLRDCERSDFCQFRDSEQDLPGFRLFVIKFMINMSRDFATRSLNISEQTPGMALQENMDQGDDGEGDLIQYIIKRRWETSPHPYVFFNGDPHTEARHSMTFIGFNVNDNGDIIDPQTQDVLDTGVITQPLQQGLKRNRVPLNENFDLLPRDQKILRLSMVMGIDMPHDPDSTYELTTDNIKKIIAIYMRFRCEIPVVVMGETGCGKTRLVKFMCDIQKPPGADIQNLILMKVHGGTTEEDIIRKVKKAVRKAEENREEFRNMDTVLFFDEANTTDAIGLIKEILCDHSMRGDPLPHHTGLKFVVACNPYRKHSDEVVRKLEQAGLGYHVKADETRDRLGCIPMRQLVYRVHALPQSMLPLVWDFGQLSTNIEELYIRQMIQRYVNIGRLPNVHGMIPVISAILSASQDFMKNQKDECSFVSLRDVDRVLQVMVWFYEHRDHIFPLLVRDNTDNQQMDDNEDDEDDEEDEEGEEDVDMDNGDLNVVTRILVLALGVCYHACLHKRTEYREYVSEKFQPPLRLPNGQETIAEEINRCQEVFLDKITLGPNIAPNQALKENLFMMIICVELRIPLFLVGKPGSSKSLAKTIVDDAMRGEGAYHELFRHLKQVHMISFQCSPLSTPDGIVATFRQCAQLQDKKDLDRYVAVVVLDEVGLAEDSPLMPLKTLHPLLEDGCEGDEEPKPHMKVACIAISNWALDPAKMNRGIHVQRSVPDIDELQESARGICSTDNAVLARIDNLVPHLAEGYLKLYDIAIKEKREFFGLRDFYSLMKMVYSFSEKSDKKPTWYQLKHAILRNFGGLDQIDPAKEFGTCLQLDTNAKKMPGDPDCTPSAMIRASLFGDGLASESRYLLILTENYAALGILQQQLLDHDNTTVIFGSSFPKDQEYTQVCRNINKIKVCMEAGRTVVLLNLENLYESLYDALNQYYVKLGDARFVDLGLGTQRVKCEVHKDFKLVVVAEKQVVYDKFPIPLINRLEKHFLAMSTMLTKQQIRVVDGLTDWAKQFATMPGRINMHRSRGSRVQDVFIGYHVDTPASIVMHVCKVIGQNEGETIWFDEVLERSQDLLLQCATPDSVIRLKDTALANAAAAYSDRYNNHQKHGSIREFLQQQIREKDHKHSGLFLQVTTHSKLLSQSEAVRIGKHIGFVDKNIKLSSLQAFDTEHQFSRMLRDWFVDEVDEDERMLLIQCDSGNQNGDLIACARYIIQDEYSQANNQDTIIHIILVVQLPRVGIGNFVGFQGGRWMCYHIDDLHSETDEDLLPSLATLEERSLATLYDDALRQKNITMVGIAESSPDPGSHDDHTAMELDHTNSSTLRHNQDEDMSEYQVDANGIVMEIDEEEAMILQPDRAQEVSCRRDAGDFQMIHDGFLAMNLQQTLRVNLERTSLRQRRGSGDAVEKCLEIDALMRKCVHKAAAMLKDYELDTNRKTERVQILHKLLHTPLGGAIEDGETGNLTVLDVINQRICLLLKDKEESVMRRPGSWLSNDAASLESVNRAGTFRQALKQYVESKVTPLLAGLIAYADRNKNMDLITKENPQSWIHQLWLLMLQDPGITQLKYSDLQTVTTIRDGEDLTEFRVETSGYNKKLFGGQLPFSWVVYHQVDMLVYQAKSRQATQDPEMMVENLLRNTPMGSMLNFVSNRGQMDAFIELYLHDFVHMVYKPHSNNQAVEQDLITNSIRVANMELQKHNDGQPDQELDMDENITDSHLTLSGIHLVYNQIQRRLHLCAQALQVWPTAVDKLIKIASEKDAPELFTVKDELTLDIQLLYLFLNELNLDKKFDDNREHKTYRAEWIKKVDIFSPTIERILNTVDEAGDSDAQYGRVSLKFYETCTYLWTRVLTVYLFVQHVCPPVMTGKTIKLYKCLPLWNILKDKADFKKETCLKVMVHFLVSCDKIARGLYFEKKNCKQCSQVIDNPVELPCKHSICMRCVQDLKDLQQLFCPDCKHKIPENIDLKPPQDKKKEVQEHNEYKKRCNTFFMELVSRLCFLGNTPPEPGVIKLLMNFVTCEHKMKIDASQGQAEPRTSSMTLYKDSIDPTPVVRSFLLQLLLRSNIDDVREHLRDFLERYHGLLRDSGLVMELCRLCVHCLEDHYFNEANKTKNASDRANYIHQLLALGYQPLTSPGLNINKLEAIASTRFSLIEVSRLMHDRYIEGKNLDLTDTDLWRLFEAARKVCIYGPPEHISQTSLYLMKQIFRQYGHPELQELGEQPHLQWVIPPPARNQADHARADRYVSLGGDYIEIREMVTEVTLGRNVIELGQLLENQQCAQMTKERNLLLALFIEITINLQKPQKPSDQVLAGVSNYFLNDHRIHQEDLLRRLLANQLANQCDHLTVAANQNARHVELVELLVHYWIIMDTIEADKLSEPLRKLVHQPQDMMQSFLPTMPGDHLEEVREALAGARNTVRGADPNPTMWQCPKGHPYVIGDCGRPYYQANCTVCGETIGGAGHRAAAGNSQLQPQQNRTAPGHILGRAQQRVNTPVPERLNATTNSILRMLVHMSMYLGANRDNQNVSLLVQQPAQVDNISEFLWQHLTLDLDVVARVLGKNPEDTTVFMHLLFDRFISVQAPRLGRLNSRLTSTGDRGDWENMFTENYITPMLRDFDGMLQETNNRLVEDNRLGNNPLLRSLYEVDMGEDREVNVENIEQERVIWSFRAMITLEHLTQEFQKKTLQPQRGTRAKQQENKLLELFLQEEHHLRVLRCLPGIVRMQRMLSQKFHRNIDSADATKMTITNFKQNHIEEHLSEEFEDMIRNFAEAWEMLKGEIGTFAVGGSTVPAEYCEQSVNDESNLAMLLPTLRGQGLCATALVHHMVHIHNNFIENYCQIKKKTVTGSISSQDVTQAHLVSYHRDRDLLPIILANCEYTLTTGQATTIDYDFGGMQKQIEDRFMRGRPRIDPDVSIIVFREEFTNAAVFTQLEIKIRQDSLAGSQQQQIYGVLHHLTELNDSLATLDITIGFLVSVGGDPDMLLLDFIRGILKMESGPLCRAVQKCGLRHTEALWLLLAHQRAKLLTAGEQDAFDLLPAGYHDDLEEDASDKLLLYFQHLTQHFNQLDLFLSRLYECIVLHIAKKPENPNAEDYIDNKDQPLGFVLDTYLDQRGYHGLPGLTDEDFPQDVCVKHCVATWKLALRVATHLRH